MPIKVLIVDDEVYIRKILRTVIERNPSFAVVGGCGELAEALILFHQHHPQVVFMDVEINQGSGIDCAKVMRELDAEVKIIFATAHAEYMSNAFEIYAFDYLVKPFDVLRIEHTLERIENDAKAVRTAGVSEKAPAGRSEKSKLMIKGKETVAFVDVAEIVLVERQNHLTYIYTKDGETFSTSTAIGELETKLPAKYFLRSHKSYIINVSMIKRIEPYGRWTYVVRFKATDRDALITKEKYEQIKTMFE